MKIHRDILRVHNTLKTAEKKRKIKMERPAHPPYVPDLSPGDFWLVGRAKRALRSRRFVDSDDVAEAPTNLFDSVTLVSCSASSRSGFGNWSE
jgi:hypothetical protein